MKLKIRNFPHPVLNPLTDDFKNSRFDGAIVEYKENDDEIVFLIEYKLKNNTLRNLIGMEKACFNAHFECASTMKRIAFSFSESDLKMISDNGNEVTLQGEIKIPSRYLNKKVDVNFFILSSENMDDYKNDEVHEDFLGESFKIQKGDILAFGITQTIHIEKEPIASSNSIFKISKAIDDKTSVSIDLSGDQIEITVPESSYDKIGRLTKFGDNYNKVLVSMLYFPALIDALFNIYFIKDDPYELAQYESLDWFRTLEKKFKNLGFDIKDLEREVITPIAYELLNEDKDQPWNALEKINYDEEDGDGYVDL